MKRRLTLIAILVLLLVHAVPAQQGPPNVPLWSSATQYQTGARVTYQSFLYTATQPSKNQIPANNPAYWLNGGPVSGGGSGGVIPPPPSDGTYCLTAVNGSLVWGVCTGGGGGGGFTLTTMTNSQLLTMTNTELQALTN